MATPQHSEKIETLWRDTARPESGEDSQWYDGVDSRTEQIKAGWRKAAGLAAFQADTIWEKDVRIVMRDGVELRTDIFRPADSDVTKVPALIAWSPYGKSGRGQSTPKTYMKFLTRHERPFN